MSFGSVFDHILAQMELHFGTVWGSKGGKKRGPKTSFKKDAAHRVRKVAGERDIGRGDEANSQAKANSVI